jgi:hypothetical protein
MTMRQMRRRALLFALLLGSEEAKGLWDKEVKELLAKSCLRLTETIPFVFGLNRLYVAAKDGA